MDNGMTTFSLGCIVKEDLSTLGYSPFPRKINALKVLKDGEAVGKWRLHSGVDVAIPTMEET